LIGHTLRQTNLLAMALESKGFGAGWVRRPLFVLKMHGADFAALAVIAVLVLGSVWMRFNGYGTI
jgi:energy-coupling factor transporter transmembrane protein EcfT